MKTHLITILVYPHNTLPPRSWGPLSDAPVKIKSRPTVFPQSCVKVSKLSIENFVHFLKVTGPHILGFWIVLDVDFDGLVRIPKFKLLRFFRNKVWIGPIYDPRGQYTIQSWNYTVRFFRKNIDLKYTVFRA